MQQQALEGMAAGEQRVEGALRDRDIGKGQLLEERPVECRLGIREDAFPKAGDVKGGGEAERRCRQRHRLSDKAPEAVVEDEVLVEEEDVELLEVVEGGGPEPAVEGHGDAGVVAAEAAVPVPVPDVEAAARARVHGERGKCRGHGLAAGAR